MNKKGVELSVNFLVVIIISLVVFAFGINFIYSIMGQANDLREKSEDQIDSQITSLNCGNTEKVCLSGSNIKLALKGEKIVTVKIINVNDVEKDFSILVKNGLYLSKNGDTVDPLDADYDNRIIVTPREREPETIAANGEKGFGIMFQVPRDTKKGRYVFDIKINSDSGQYDLTHKVYVTVV